MPYNTKNIRTLLTAGFTGEELRRFCYDAAEFRPVYDQLAESSGKTEVVQRLVEYAERQLLLEQLLAWAKESNPARFKRHKPYIVGSGTEEATKKNPPMAGFGHNVQVNTGGPITDSTIIVGGGDITYTSSPAHSTSSGQTQPATERRATETAPNLPPDETQRAHWRELLARHHKNLRHLKEQKAQYGSLDAPLRILNQIENEKAEIEQLEKLLGRAG